MAVDIKTAKPVQDRFPSGDVFAFPRIVMSNLDYSLLFFIKSVLFFAITRITDELGFEQRVVSFKCQGIL